jgi:hypothetical protein
MARGQTADGKDLLRHASRSIFLTGVGDTAEALCRANMAYGLAKVHWVQRGMGLPPDACFVGAPDATITRNVERWESGFSYGGRIRYSGDFAVLSVKSNCCGIYFGVVADTPGPDAVLEGIRRLQSQRPEVSGTALTWDFGNSNHFISVLRLRDPIRNRTAAVMVHGSGPELRGPGPHGPGLYVDASPRLRQLAETVDTPLGPVTIVRGAGLAEYWDGYRAAEAHSRQRRKLIADALFPGVEEVSNTTHQGLLAPNDIVLGCIAQAPGVPVPLALRADLPVPIVEMLPNLAPHVLERTGIGPWARQLGLYDRVAHANILPHGGGYTLPGLKRLEAVSQIPAGRVFELSTGKGRSARVFHRNFRHVPFGYRGEEVLRQVESLELGRVLTVGDPEHEYMV